MKIVLSWLREFAPTDMGVDELAELITQRGVKVEAVLHPWEGLDGVVAARVLDVSDHPDSDKLCVAQVDDGTGAQVVCAGVRNFAAGDLVPWAKPGSRVPALAEPLAPRRLRGVMSNGMLCSLRELNIADTHEGILVFDDLDGLRQGEDVKTSLGLDDAVLDIEVEPNRPDFLSVFGVAREVSAATGAPLLDPDRSIAEIDEAADDVASVTLEALDACPEYLAKIIRGVDATRRSPLPIQARLTAAGMRPVSAVVDATNYAMLELGQPLHAFDMAMLAGPGIVVRHAIDDERIVTLDDVERLLDHEDLLICDRERPVAIGGVMGGATSEVSETTVDVLLESAYFTRTGVLRSARRLDLHSEASHRFERGTDPEGLERGAIRGAGLIAEWSGGSVLRGVTSSGEPPPRRWTSMRPARASRLLGYEVTGADARAVFDLLRLTHRPSAMDDGTTEVEVPGYRVDIEREVDLIEEVARMQGYERIGSDVPSAGQVGGEPPAATFRRRLRDALVRAGLREVRSFSFASKADLELAGDSDAIEIANPLQADERYLRTRLTPGLLRTVARNQARGSEAVTIFEVGTVFGSDDPVDEREKVAFALAGPASEDWAAEDRPFDVLDATGVLEAMCAELGVPSLVPGSAPHGPFHPGRSAFVELEGRRVGVVGELHPRVAESLELQGRVAVAELEVSILQEAAGDGVVIADVPRFPPVRRDLAFVVPHDVAAGDVKAALVDAAGALLTRCLLFDVFEGDPLPAGTKSLGFSLEFRSAERTLTGEETDPLVEAVAHELAGRFGATLRTG